MKRAIEAIAAFAPAIVKGVSHDMRRTSRFLRPLLAALAAACVAVSPAFAQTAPSTTPVPKPDFVVSPTGDDAGPGTVDKPFATLTKARDAVRTLKQTKKDDIVIQIRGGVYPLKETLVFGLEDSGGEGQQIVYAAYPGENPQILGSSAIENWEKVTTEIPHLASSAKAKLWFARLPHGVGRFNTLYDSQGLLPRSRSRRLDGDPRNAVQGNEMQVERSNNDFSRFLTCYLVPGQFQKTDNVTDMELVIRPFRPWTMANLPIESYDEKTGGLKTTAMGVCRLVPFGVQEHEQTKKDMEEINRYIKDDCFLENSIEFIDEPGEWAVDSKAGVVYLWPRVDERPANIRVGLLTELIRVEGQIRENELTDIPVKNIVFRGLTFTQTERLTNPPDAHFRFLLNGMNWHDTATAAVRFRGAENCLVDACRFHNGGGDAIRLDLHCQNNHIQNCYIHDMGGGGIQLIGYGMGFKDVNHHNRIANNIITRIGKLTWHMMGILVWQSGSNIIEQNDLKDMPFTSIALVGRPRWEIMNPYRPNIFRTGRPEEIKAVVGDLTYESYEYWELAKKSLLHTKNNLVRRNAFGRCEMILGDGNAIYICGTGYDNVIRENYFKDGWNPLRTDGTVGSARIEFNVVVNAVNNIGNGGNAEVCDNVFIKGRVALFGAAHDDPRLRPADKMHRNIFYQGARPDISFGIPDEHKKNKVSTDYNLYWWGPEQSLKLSQFLDGQHGEGFDLHSVIADPMFVDPDNKDYRVREDSPARKLGIIGVDARGFGATDANPFRQQANLEKN